MIALHESPRAHRNYVPPLLILLTLFTFRVLAQLLQKLYPVDFLPAFSAWQSGTLPYSLLLCSQVAIILVSGFTIRGFIRRTTIPRRSLGKWLLGSGAIYFGAMVLRISLGLTIAREHPWLGAKIPAFFHLVLASFVLLVGHFHLRAPSQA